MQVRVMNNVDQITGRSCLIGPFSSRSVADSEEVHREPLDSGAGPTRDPSIEADSDGEEFDYADDRSLSEVEEGNSGGAEEGLRRSHRVRKPPEKLNDYSCIAYTLIAESFVVNAPDTIEVLWKLKD